MQPQTVIFWPSPVTHTQFPSPGTCLDVRNKQSKIGARYSPLRTKNIHQGGSSVIRPEPVESRHDKSAISWEFAECFKTLDAEQPQTPIGWLWLNGLESKILQVSSHCLPTTRRRRTFRSTFYAELYDDNIVQWILLRRCEASSDEFPSAIWDCWKSFRSMGQVLAVRQNINIFFSKFSPQKTQTVSSTPARRVASDTRLTLTPVPGFEFCNLRPARWPACAFIWATLLLVKDYGTQIFLGVHHYWLGG